MAPSNFWLWPLENYKFQTHWKATSTTNIQQENNSCSHKDEPFMFTSHARNLTNKLISLLVLALKIYTGKSYLRIGHESIRKEKKNHQEIKSTDSQQKSTRQIINSVQSYTTFKKGYSVLVEYQIIPPTCGQAIHYFQDLLH